MVNSVLVVCTGNVCRSPVGERLLRQACPTLTVDSAGTMAMIGHCADPTAHAVATSNGLCLAGHVARQLTPDMVRRYDLLLVMELEHIKQVMALAPWARGKTLLFGLWNGPAVMPSVQQEVLRLSREVESGQAVYLQLLSRQQELSISRSGITGNVRIIDTANIYPDPIKPQKVLIVLLGALSGLLLSTGGVLVLNILRQRVETPEQLEAAQLHVCATVPQSAWLLKATRHMPGGGTPLLVRDNPNDLTVEAIRSLRTSLHFDMLEREHNVLVVTGTTPDCGKTFVSSTLAIVMAQSGQRVLFIDADMRRGDAHRVFGLEQGEGLSSLLSGEKTIPCVLRTFDKMGLDVITCGANLQDPTTLLMGARFKTLLAWARQKYDVVIVDTPPALAVIDAAIIGRMTPLTLVVTRAGLNSVKETTLCVKKLEQEGISVKGVVLNGVVPGALSYFRDGYRCEGYRYTAPDN